MRTGLWSQHGRSVVPIPDLRKRKSRGNAIPDSEEQQNKGLKIKAVEDVFAFSALSYLATDLSNTRHILICKHEKRDLFP
jgi:hypothetical protein